MCFSENQSKIVFITNIITCFMIYNHKNSTNTHKIIALFFLFVGFMQLFDVIFWKNQNMNDKEQKSINFTTTKIAMFFNHLQPIVLGLLILLYFKKLGKLSKILLIIYTIIILLYTFDIYNKIDYTIVDNVNFLNRDKPSLKWDWNYKNNHTFVYIIFIITLLYISYENFSYPTNILLSFILLISFVLSKSYFKGKVVGRFWCKIAALVPLLFLFIN